MKRENIVVIQDSAAAFAKMSGKAVARIKAIGPMNCQDPEKVEKIWQFYDGKIPDAVFDTLRSFGEVFCFFDTPNEAITNLEHWFPTLQLIDDDEYDEVDRDYYITVESADPTGIWLYGT